MTSIETENTSNKIPRQYRYQFVCKDRVYEDSGVCCSQEGGSRGGPSMRY